MKLSDYISTECPKNNSRHWSIFWDTLCILIISSFVDEILLVVGVNITSLSQQSCPHLDTNNTKYEEHKKAEEQHIAQHWKSVQQQHHQYPHTLIINVHKKQLIINFTTWNPIDSPQRSEHPDCSYGSQVNSSFRIFKIIQQSSKLIIKFKILVTFLVISSFLLTP